MGWNRIGSDFVRDMIPTFQSLPRLEKIDLTGNNVAADGVRQSVINALAGTEVVI